MKKPKILLFSMAAFLLLIPAKSAFASETADRTISAEIAAETSLDTADTLETETEAPESETLETETTETETTETETVETESTETETAESEYTETETAETESTETETAESMPPETKAPETEADLITESEENINTESFLSSKAIDTSKYENQDVCNFVVRMYDKFLGRTPDAQGLDFWYNKLVSKELEGANIVDGFISSDEFTGKKLDTDAFLEILYNGMFDRNADQTGKATWSDILSAGVSQRYISAQFINSNEFNQLCQSYNISRGDIELTESRDQNVDITRFVNHFYQECLNRQGDAEGLNTWTGGLLNQSFTGTDIVDGFIFSNEFTGKKLDNQSYIETLYRAILSRNSDSEGLSTWMTYMENGVSTYFIAAHFINSPEFINNCAEHNIIKGEPVLTENRDKNYAMTSLTTGLYINALKHAPSAAALNSWTGQLLEHQLTAFEFANAIFNSDEYKSQNTTDTQYITDLYMALLKRLPSTEEMQAQIDALTASNNNRQAVLDILNRSSEYNDICYPAGISMEINDWFTYHDKIFYYENRIKKTGWLRKDGERYYLNPSKDGERQTGWEYIDGYKFYFQENGTLLQDLDSIIGYQDSYLIKVYKWGNYAIVFAKDGDNGYIIPVRAMITSCGNGTPTGDYWTEAKYRWCTMVGGSQAQWCTQIVGDYLFHSVPYRITDNTTLYTDLMYNWLGTTQSLGCIRLQCKDAKWVYDHCQVGTHVNIDPYVNEGPFDKPEFHQIPSWHTWDPTDPTAYYLCQQHGCH